MVNTLFSYPTFTIGPAEKYYKSCQLSKSIGLSITLKLKSIIIIFCLTTLKIKSISLIQLSLDINFSCLSYLFIQLLCLKLNTVNRIIITLSLKLGEDTKRRIVKSNFQFLNQNINLLIKHLYRCLPTESINLVSFCP